MLLFFFLVYLALLFILWVVCCYGLCIFVKTWLECNYILWGCVNQVFLSNCSAYILLSDMISAVKTDRKRFNLHKEWHDIIQKHHQSSLDINTAPVLLLQKDNHSIITVGWRERQNKAGSQRERMKREQERRD